MGRVWLLYSYSNSIKILDVLLMVKLICHSQCRLVHFFLTVKTLHLSAQKNGYDVTVVTERYLVKNQRSKLWA